MIRYSKIIKISLILCFSTVSACSSIPKHSDQDVNNSALADTVATMVALSQGHQEINPLGFPAATVGKIILIRYLRPILSDHEQDFINQLSSSLWWGASANNLAVILGLPTIIAVAVGVAVTIDHWQKDQIDQSK